jgi:UTP-glucose-1-phosphate uridylyltransferase
MHPVAAKPMILHVVEEAVAAGIKEIYPVLRRAKKWLVRSLLTEVPIMECSWSEKPSTSARFP